MIELRIRSTGVIVVEPFYRFQLEVQALQQGKCLFLPLVVNWSDYDADVVFPTPHPTPDAGQRVERDGVVQDANGNWVQAWKLVNISQEQLSADLIVAKTAKNTQINQWREDATYTSFMWSGKEIACDRLSRSDINGVADYVALFGSLPPDFPGQWKAKDNTYAAVPDVAAFKSMFSAMVAQGTANFIKSQQLKAALANATTIETVKTIVW